MYYGYMHEAGASAQEPLSVVVSVIVRADRHWKKTAELVQSLIHDFVPARYRRGFVFHARQIWSDQKHRNDWPLEERAKFIAAMAAVPRSLGLAISLGKCRRDWSVDEAPHGLTLGQLHHISAFGACAARMDKYVHDCGGPDEIAMIVAADDQRIRRFLKIAFANLKVVDGGVPMTAELKTFTKAEPKSGVIRPTDYGEMTRIVDTVRFVEKRDAPILQVADACAFAFRRYFAEQEMGAEWVKAMLGSDLVWEDWQSASSDAYFNFANRK